MNATRPYWWYVNLGSDNGFLPSGKKPLPEAIKAQFLSSNVDQAPCSSLLGHNELIVVFLIAPRLKEMDKIFYPWFEIFCSTCEVLQRKSLCMLQFKIIYTQCLNYVVFFWHYLMHCILLILHCKKEWCTCLHFHWHVCLHKAGVPETALSEMQAHHWLQNALFSTFPTGFITTHLLSIEYTDWPKLHDMFKAHDA